MRFVACSTALMRMLIAIRCYVKFLLFSCYFLFSPSALPLPLPPPRPPTTLAMPPPGSPGIGAAWPPPGSGERGEEGGLPPLFNRTTPQRSRSTVPPRTALVPPYHPAPLSFHRTTPHRPGTTPLCRRTTLHRARSTDLGPPLPARWTTSRWCHRDQRRADLGIFDLGLISIDDLNRDGSPRSTPIDRPTQSHLHPTPTSSPSPCMDVTVCVPGRVP